MPPVVPDPDAVAGSLQSRAGATRYDTGRTAARTSRSAGEAARRAAGLANQTSNLTIALKTTQDAAAKDLASAQMSKARLLRRTGPKHDDRNIAATMNAAAGAAKLDRSTGGAESALGDRERISRRAARPRIV